MANDTIRIVYDRSSFAILRVHNPDDADDLDALIQAPAEDFVDAPGPGYAWVVGDPTSPMAVPTIEAFQMMMLGAFARTLGGLPKW